MTTPAHPSPPPPIALGRKRRAACARLAGPTGRGLALALCLTALTPAAAAPGDVPAAPPPRPPGLDWPNAAALPATLDDLAGDRLAPVEACRQAQAALDAHTDWPDPGDPEAPSCLVITESGRAVLTRGQHAWALRRAQRLACKGKHPILLELLHRSIGVCAGGTRTLAAAADGIGGCVLTTLETGHRVRATPEDVAQLRHLDAIPLLSSLAPPGATALISEVARCLDTPPPPALNPLGGADAAAPH